MANPVVLQSDRCMFRGFYQKEANGNFPASQSITVEFEQGAIKLTSTKVDFSKIQPLTPYKASFQVVFKSGTGKDGKPYQIVEVANAAIEEIGGSTPAKSAK